MSSPLLGASAFDLDELDAFLMSDRAPEGGMQLSDLDGFLVGVAIGPELIMPSEWIPVIWGGGEPEFENMEEAQRILDAIMCRYNKILHLLLHAPKNSSRSSGRPRTERWSLPTGLKGSWTRSSFGHVHGGVAGLGRRQAAGRADRRPPARRGRRSDHPR